MTYHLFRPVKTMDEAVLDEASRFENTFPGMAGRRTCPETGAQWKDLCVSTVDTVC